VFTARSELDLYIRYCLGGSRESSVGIAIELLAGCSGDRVPVGGEIFLHLSGPALKVTQSLIRWVPALSPG